MPRILGAFPSALIAARNGMGANEYYRYLQSLGMGARRSEVLALYRQALEINAKSGDEIFRDITKVPTENELSPWPTRKATGVRQNVTLIYRDKTTGAILHTHWSTTSEQGITREEAMATAISKYADQAERYNQDLIGAVHTGAYRYQPFDESP